MYRMVSVLVVLSAIRTRMRRGHGIIIIVPYNFLLYQIQFVTILNLSLW